MICHVGYISQDLFKDPTDWLVSWDNFEYAHHNNYGFTLFGYTVYLGFKK